MGRETVVTSLRWMGVLAGLWLTAAAAADGPTASPDARWYSIRLENGIAIGYAYHDSVARADGRETIDHQEILISEPTIRTMMHPDAGVHLSRQIWHTVTRENAQGETTGIVSDAQSGNDKTQNTATIANGVATVTHKTETETHTLTVALPQGVRFDGGEALIRGWDRKGTLEFENFNVDAIAVEHIVIAPLPAAASDALGTTEALRRRYADGLLVGQSRILIDGTGRFIEVHQPMLGTDLMTRAAERTVALKYDAYRVFPNIMRKSPYRIQKEALAGHIRYSFGFRDGAPFAIPETGEQRVKMKDGVATVDICATCGPGLSSDAATLAAALKPTMWLQSDSAQIRTIAAEATAKAKNDVEKMTLLTEEAHRRLPRVNFSGHYSALTALQRGSGDCTEEAALLAAFGRAAGIPTRVVNGLVYSREKYHGVSNTFMPHSWVLAYADGRWRSFDSALGDFDSTHIALTISDGDERSIAAAGLLSALLEWQGMAEVKARPAP